MINLRAAGLKVHKVIAMSPLISKLYFYMLSVFVKPLPDGCFKKRLINSIMSIDWPPIDLPAQKIEIEKVAFCIFPHLGEDDLESLLMREMTYEPSVFSFLNKSNNKYEAIIEIGANVGIYTVFFSKFYEHCQIYAFEPSREAYSRLLRNIELNGFSKNVHTFNTAVGESTGFITFYEPRGHLKNGSLLKDFASIFSPDVVEHKVLSVQGELLAGLFEKHSSVLLKIDAEGSEASILKSLLPIIRFAKPDILVECLGMFEDEMNNLGLSEWYDLYQLTKNGAVLRSAFKSSEDRDYMLFPKKATS